MVAEPFAEVSVVSPDDARDGVLLPHRERGGWAGASASATPVPLDATKLRLVVQRKMYDGATRTQHSGALRDLYGDNQARLHPLDFEKLGIAAGAEVTLHAEVGEVTLPAVDDPGVVRGTVVVLANVPDATVNHLLSSTSPIVDVRLEVAR